MTSVGSYQRRTSVLVIVSSITTALGLFVIFRVTAAMASVQWIGVWSLVQGLFLLARISDSGAGANISRVIAVRVKGAEPLQLRNLTAASLVIASLPSVVISAVSAPVVGLYITHRFGGKLNGGTLWEIVWLGFGCASLAAVAGVFMAVPEGVFELNRKSWFIIAANAVGIAAVAPLISIFGPAGIAWSALLTNLTQLLLAGARVFALGASEPRATLRGIGGEISLLWRENLHLSGVALIRLSFEPATKFLLSLFAPLIVMAQFELALRFTGQIRIVVQAALQPLLVMGARAGDRCSEDLREVFVRNDRALVALSVGGLIAQIVAAPVVEWLGFGSSSFGFTVFIAILAAGNAINIMGLAGYYWQLASGDLLPLLRVQGVMAVMNVGLGAAGLWIDSATCVVASYALAFAFGGSVARSFLGAISVTSRATSTGIAIAAGVMGAGIMKEFRPTSPASLVALTAVCVGVGSFTLFLSYRAHTASLR